MSFDLACLLWLTGAGAALPIVHLAVLVRLGRLVRERRLAVGWWLLGWLPPATLVVAWRAGARRTATIWLLAVALYGAAWAVCW